MLGVFLLVATGLALAEIHLSNAGTIAEATVCFEKMEKCVDCVKDISELGYFELRDPTFCHRTENLFCDLTDREACVMDKMAMRGKCCKLPAACLDSCNNHSPVMHDPVPTAAEPQQPVTHEPTAVDQPESPMPETPIPQHTGM